MPTLRLGSTELAVSRLGLGLAALGRPAYITLGRERDLGGDRSAAELERRCHQMLDAAYAAGIRYFDAARSYGMAENFLGTWLGARRPPADAITVGSKWGYTYVGSWRLDAPVHEVKDLSVDTLRRQIVESRSLLGNRLQLYQIHSATLESRVLENTDVLHELLKLRSSGLAVGLTVTGPNQPEVIRRALRVSIDGQSISGGAGDVELARAFSGSGPGRGERTRVGRDRQGGARQRPPDGPSRRRARHNTQEGSGSAQDDDRRTRSGRSALAALDRCRPFGGRDHRTTRKQSEGDCHVARFGRFAPHRGIGNRLLGTARHPCLAVGLFRSRGSHST